MRTREIQFIDNKFIIRFPFHADVTKSISDIFTDVKWSKKKLEWSIYELDILTIQQLYQFRVNHDFEVSNDAKTELLRLHKVYQNNLNLSHMEHPSGIETPSGRFKLHGKLLPYQEAGVEYAVLNKRCFIADPMGLGKTIQALESVNRLHAFPCIVICKSALKENWKNEIAKFYPDMKVQVLSNQADLITNQDVYIINFDILVKETVKRNNRRHVILSDHLTLLSEIGIKSIICDESHYLKTSTSNRTKGAMQLTRGVDVLFALSGTPWLNRTEEIASQLQWLGLLGHFGGWYTFAKRYCKMKKRNINGRTIVDTSGSENEDELNTRLRSIGYVRRKKENVLKDLPPLHRIKTIIEIDNTKEYKKARDEFAKWLVAEGKRDSESRVGVNEALIQLIYLRQIASRGKIAYITQWVDDYLKETDENVVIFAHHKEIQYALESAFPRFATLIDKSSDEKEIAKTKLAQDPKCRGIICSLMSDKEGHTITSASTVIFAELDWTPGNHEQAEARCHRISQKRNVSAYYFIGNNTIDTHINNILENKSDILRIVSDGNPFAKILDMIK
jgi:SWI/SNF-related matrix-associated actin-dependent regulator 1 of chromatin subfamily A